MADYYPLIARAIAGLDPSAPGESRRALYERARAALIAQLRSVEPPLSESEITRERLSLEEAVRKVESEAAQRARESSRAADPARAGARASSALRGNARSAARPAEGIPPPPGQAPRSRPPAPPQRGPEDLGQGRNGRPEGPREPQVSMQDPSLPPTRERIAASRRGPDTAPQAPGVRGFRDITADVDDLGRAAAQASRAARKTYANVPSPSPEFDRLEPLMNDRSGDSDAPYSYDESMEEAERYAPPPAPRPRLSQDRGREPKENGRKGIVFPFKSAIALSVILIVLGAVAYVLGSKTVLSSVSGLFKSSPVVVEAPRDSGTPATRPKIPDRVGQPSSTEQVAPVAQRVVLYDEDPSDPKGKQYIGSVIWRTEQIKATGNQKGDVAVRADIEIPDRKFKMTMSFRRNTDSSLPASHTAELTFVLPADFSGGGVSNVPGILMKSNEQARGTPLAGLAVKVTDGFFLVGLSNVDADRSHNLQLLKERSWFDVPLVYVNQRRAIIAIEKGSPGERAFNDAFAAWGE